MKINFINLGLVFVILFILNGFLASVGVPQFALFILAFGFSFYSKAFGLPIVKTIAEEKDENSK